MWLSTIYFGRNKIFICKEIDLSLLSQYFEYDPISGEIYWVASPQNHNKIGKLAGSLNKNDGYLYINFCSEKYPAHRVAWALHYGKWPEKYLDHIDRDKQNNKIENLRGATKRENTRNRCSNKGTTSKYLGVSWHKDSQKWVAQIQENNIRKYLGGFSSEAEAAKKYNEHASRIYGDFASLNLIKEN